MDSIDKLKNKRKVVRAASTKLINEILSFLEKCNLKNGSDKNKLSRYLLNVDEKIAQLKYWNDKIEELITDSEIFETDIQSSFEYEENLNEAKFQIKCKIETKTEQPITPTSVLAPINVGTNHPITSINLPKLRIPTFSGDPSNFLEFFNSFKSAVDDNESFREVDKFIYLKSFLSGEAYKIVSGFSLTEENYKSCLELLEERYGKQEHLISHFINKLLEIEPVKSSFNIKGLRKLHDESEISIRNLNAMKIDSVNYGHLLIPILLKQLPHDLVIEYHRKRDPNKTGDVKELMKFLKFEIESRESANIVAGHAHKVSEFPRQYSRNSHFHVQHKFKNNTPSSSALNTVVKNVCIFCKCDTHPALKCKSLTNEQKRYKLKKEGFCYRCMLYKHLMSQCNVKIPPCETCQSSQHNSLFCPKNKTESPPTSESKAELDKQVIMTSVLNSQNKPGSYITLLQTAKVEIQGNKSQKLIARLLFDSGSQKSFIRSDLKKALNLKTIRKEKLLIYTFSQCEPMEKICDVVTLKLTSVNQPHKNINIEALVSDEISGANIYSNINPRHIQNVLPASCLISDSYEESKTPIQILLGADFMYNAMSGEARKINKNLFIQPTVFGDTLIGQLCNREEETKQTSVFNVSCSILENDLKSLWQIDSFLLNNESAEIKSSDTLCNFGKELKMINKRYECPLQWKSQELKNNLSNNLDVAKKRFTSLEKRFISNESLFEKYNAVMKEQMQAGIIEMCSDDCFTGYVMPHREVLRESSSSTKTRIVYDASSKLGSNNSLNECLVSGENLYPNLVDVILKFREHKIAFCGDIARAFLQILVTESDRNYLCFLYYKNCDQSQPVTLYHFNRHCFGVTCSPFVLAATIKAHIKKYKEKHPLAYKMLNESLYVDDLFHGCSTVQEAFALSSDAVSILKDANMNMRKFDTNSKQLKELWINTNPDIEVNENTDSPLKVLGLVWNNLDDTIGLNLHSLSSDLNDSECTKRNVLHIAAKLFDPTGFISPFLMRIKCLLQELWQLGIGWDEVFTEEIKENFQNWCKEIKDLQNLKIPRYYFPDQDAIDNQDIQLHIFSDSSLKSFGAVAYIRYKTSKGTFQTSFIISKSRVAPIKKLTLPRLELMGAVIASRIVKHLKGIFKDIKRIVLWSDSTIVLHWIKGSASKYKQFVANRITEIQESTDPSSWKHCSGKHNPADLLTRGLSSRDLITSKKWWHGPEWLKETEEHWPKSKEFKNKTTNSEITSEYKSCVIVSSAIFQEKILDPENFSSLLKMLRVTAWVLRFVNVSKKKNTEKGPLTSDELTIAELFWVRIIQNDSYSSEITCLKNNKPLPKDSKLLCLNPFLDSNGILSVTGRLGKSTRLSPYEKHPMILPPKAKLTELLIWESHKRVFHSGVSHTLVQIREKYWILKARQTIKSLLGKCTICKRFNSSPGTQVTAPLPDVRVEQSAPFTIVGVDFAGPLFVKDSNFKQYILLITCAVTRSVHLELVGDMTTETFLLAFRRFISRRGLCSVVISDNARTFKRAEKEIKLIWKVLNHPDVKNFYSTNGIKWQYIVERAAWWGGFYERMVRTVKTALRKSLGRSCLTIDQLLTVLIEIEGMINSRPITYVGTDTEEPTALTPAHFLLGRRITSLPSVRLHLDSNLSSRKCFIKAFNYREKLMRSFWTRWKNEYLLNLRSAHSSSVKTSSPFKVNDVVLIKDDYLPRNFWKLGKIVELFPGRDGKVRACKIKTESATIKRPVQLLYNLEIQDSSASV